jgi:sporulation protein YlmC with PRC-barrel domain
MHRNVPQSEWREPLSRDSSTPDDGGPADVCEHVGMSSLGRLEPGRAVRCEDGPYGELADIVIDPVKRRVTHLVVQPHDDGLARLVPIEMATGGDGEGEITLRCTAAEASRLTTVRESASIRMDEMPRSDPDWDIGIQDVITVPYESPELGVVTGGGYDEPVELTYDRVPKGKVEIRRSSEVISADDHFLGHVEAFLTDDGALTHLVLEHGHLWGRRDVTIPMDAVAKVETDSVTLRLSKDEVGALPSVRVRR